MRMILIFRIMKWKTGGIHSNVCSEDGLENEFEGEGEE